MNQVDLIKSKNTEKIEINTSLVKGNQLVNKETVIKKLAPQIVHPNIGESKDNLSNKQSATQSHEQINTKLNKGVQSEDSKTNSLKLFSSLPLAPFTQLPIPNNSKLPEGWMGQFSDASKKADNFWSIGLLAGVESSTVKETAFCVPKWKIGLHADYHFAKKFSTSIGVNFTSKEYVAMGESYDAPRGFWSRSRNSGEVVVPETVKADCNVLEIPISFSYFTNGYRNKGFYISAGLSSFIMLTENYQYRYTDIDNSLRQQWGTLNENQHLFSNAEFAFGYQIPFTNHSSLMVGPYLQLPISGIGHGNIDVLSLGFTAKYRLHMD